MRASAPSPAVPAAGSRAETPRSGLAAITFLLSALLVGGLCAGFDPRWETNDDVGMAMAAHGFGLATYGTPNLIYSNVLWGHLVRALPEVGGVLGYSLAALASLFFACWTMLHGLLRLGAGRVATILAMLLVVVPAVLRPQFTVTSGLLAVASVVAVTVYDRHGGVHRLLLAALLGITGFLVRYEEFLLVMAVAAPLLPWRRLAGDRAMLLAVAAAGLAILGAAAFDRQAYSGKEWLPHLALDAPRAQFTDFNIGDRLLAERPDIAARHGYSRNDIDLVGNYFFPDTNIADPTALQAMLAELGPATDASGGMASGREALKAILQVRLLPLLVCGLALFALRPRWQTAAAWLVFLVTIFAIGFSGRPGVDVLRVYVPPLSLLVLMPLASLDSAPRWRQLASASIVLVAAAWQLWITVPPAIASRPLTANIQQDLRRLPPASLVAWGGAFPFTHAFPVLARDQELRNLRIYALGADTRAPYTVAAADERAGNGFLARLASREGIPMMLFDRHEPMLEEYCREHHGGRLERLARSPSASLRILTFRCVPDPARAARPSSHPAAESAP